MATSGRAVSGRFYNSEFYVKWWRIRVEGRSTVIGWEAGIAILAAGTWWGSNSIRITGGNVQGVGIAAGTWGNLNGVRDHALRSGEARVWHDDGGHGYFELNMSATAYGNGSHTVRQGFTLDNIGPAQSAPAAVWSTEVKYHEPSRKYYIGLTCSHWGVGGLGPDHNSCTVRFDTPGHPSIAKALTYGNSTYKEFWLKEEQFLPNLVYTVYHNSWNGVLASSVTGGQISFTTMARPFSPSQTSTGFDFELKTLAHNRAQVRLTHVPADLWSHRGGWENNRKLRLWVGDDGQEKELQIGQDGKRLAHNTWYDVTLPGNQSFDQGLATVKGEKSGFQRITAAWSNNHNQIAVPTAAHKALGVFNDDAHGLFTVIRPTIEVLDAKVLDNGKISVRTNFHGSFLEQDGTQKAEQILTYSMKKKGSGTPSEVSTFDYTTKFVKPPTTINDAHTHVFDLPSSLPLESGAEYEVTVSVDVPIHGVVRSEKFTMVAPQQQQVSIKNIRFSNVDYAANRVSTSWDIEIRNVSNSTKTYNVSGGVAVEGGSTSLTSTQEVTVPKQQTKTVTLQLSNVQLSNQHERASYNANVTEPGFPTVSAEVDYTRMSLAPAAPIVDSFLVNETRSKMRFSLSYGNQYKENLFGIGNEAKSLSIKIFNPEGTRVREEITIPKSKFTGMDWDVEIPVPRRNQKSDNVKLEIIVNPSNPDAPRMTPIVHTATVQATRQGMVILEDGTRYWISGLRDVPFADSEDPSVSPYVRNPYLLEGRQIVVIRKK